VLCFCTVTCICILNAYLCNSVNIKVSFPLNCHVAVLTGRITGLARPSVRLSVCPAQGPNSKIQERRKTKIGVNNDAQGKSNR